MPSDMLHGHEQVRSMLKDRPKMSFYEDNAGISHEVDPNDEIWNWAASKFSGSDFGKPVSWSSEIPIRPESCFFADHSYVKNRIRVASKFCSTADLPFDLLWRLATFELLNIEGADEFKKIQNDLLECKLNREEYIRKNLAVEYGAKLRQINFYKNVWLPWTIEKSVKSDLRYWAGDVKPLDDWLEWLKNSSTPNGWTYWGYFYDNELSPFLSKRCPEK